MLQCDGPCDQWIHLDCDREMTTEIYEWLGFDENEDTVKYWCPPCRTESGFRSLKQHLLNYVKDEFPSFLAEPDTKPCQVVIPKKETDMTTMVSMLDFSQQALVNFPTIGPNSISPDSRNCASCSLTGDQAVDQEGRLLPIIVNETSLQWIHVNCAIWGAGVNESEDGILSGVEKSLKRSQTQVCSIISSNE